MTLFGWDQSHFDAPSIGTAYAEGIRFVTHKAGGDANDAELPAWWAGVKDDALAGRLLVGAYWVLYPGRPAGRADDFIDRLDSACPGWRTVPFILQADCEKWNGDAGTVPSRAEIAAFCDRLVVRMPKLRPVVYGPKWVYGDSLSGLRYPLWASAYVTGAGPFRPLYPGDSSSRWNAYSGQVPAILQYTSSATIGGQTTCDANAFRGTLDELTRLVAPGWIEEDSVTTQSDMIAALNTYFGSDPAKGGAPYVPANPDGLKENLIAVRVASQPYPNVFRPNADGTIPRTPFWVLITDMANAIANGDGATDAQAIATAVLAGLTPELIGQAITSAGLTPAALAAAIPADMAEEVVDLLGARISGS